MKLYRGLLLLLLSTNLFAQSSTNLTDGIVNINPSYGLQFSDSSTYTPVKTGKLIWSMSEKCYYAWDGAKWVRLINSIQNKIDTVFSVDYDVCKWEKQTDKFSDFARDGNMVCQLGKYVYCLGGWNIHTDSKTNNEVYITEDLKHWTKLPNAPWEGRHCFGCVTKNDTLFIFGGDYIRGHFQTDSWCATADSNGNLKWYQLTKSLPWGQRTLFGSCLHNNAIYVIGGQSGADYDKGGFGDVWKSYDGKNWEKVAEDFHAFKKNMAGNVVSFNGYIYAVSGGIYTDKKSYKTYDQSVLRSRNGVDWERLPDVPYMGRQFQKLIVYKNRLFSLFGSNENTIPANLGGIWCMDTLGNWFRVKSNVPARHAAGAIAYQASSGDEKILIVGGNMWNDVWTGELNDTTSIAQTFTVTPLTYKKFDYNDKNSLFYKFNPNIHPYRAIATLMIILVLSFSGAFFFITRYYYRKLAYRKQP